MQSGVPSDHFRHLGDGPLGKPAGRLVRQRLGGEAELVDDAVAALFQFGEEQLVDIGGVGVALGRTGLSAPRQGLRHLGVADQAEIDVGRKMRGRRGDHVVGDSLHVMPHRGADVVKRADGPLGGRALPRADGRRAFRLAPPAALQLVEGRVIFAPLAAGEEAPFQRVLQAVVILPVFPPGNLGHRAADIQAVEDAVVPGTVAGALPDEVVEFAPVGRRDRSVPSVEVAQDDAQAPRHARVAGLREERQGFLDAPVRLLPGGPARILRQARPAGTSGGVKVADEHVVEQDVVQAARA